MPLISNTSSYTALGGDLGGTANNGRVLNISNVVSGVLKIDNGGTGLTGADLLPRSFVYVDADGKYSFLTGSAANDVIYFDGTDWKIKTDPTLSIPSSFYDIFSLATNSNLFIATPSDVSGSLTLRSLSDADLPSEMYDKKLYEAYIEGSFQGSALGNFNGNATIAEASIDNALVSNATIENVSIAGGSLRGTFYGDGANLTGISVKNIVDMPSIADDVFLPGENIYLQDQGDTLVINTSDNLNLISVTASAGFSGDGSGLVNIANTSLQNDYIVINGDVVQLGQTINIIDTLRFISSDSRTIFTTGSNIDTFYVNLVDDIYFDSAAAGHFSGSGAGIFNIQPDNIEGRLINQSNSFEIGHILSNDGTNYITASYNNNYEIVGIVSYADSSSFKYKNNLNVFVSGSSIYSKGDKVYVGNAGCAELYSNIPSGKYAKLVGIKVDDNKIATNFSKIVKVWK